VDELIYRFLVGGVFVSVFAVLGDVLRPKSFAGLFGAAPSIALATLGLMVSKHGTEYAALESRSMMMGACAFVAYAAAVSFTLRRGRSSTLITTIVLMPIWFAVAFGAYRILR
jgi:hypothetical protein